MPFWCLVVPASPAMARGMTTPLTHGAASRQNGALAAIATATVQQDVPPTVKSRAKATPVADLDSLLDALPEAPPAGGRSARRPRRATKSATSGGIPTEATSAD